MQTRSKTTQLARQQVTELVPKLEKTVSIQDRDSCPICFEQFSLHDCYTQSCKHQFHIKCIMGYREYKPHLNHCLLCFASPIKNTAYYNKNLWGDRKFVYSQTYNTYEDFLQISENLRNDTCEMLWMIRKKEYSHIINYLPAHMLQTNEDMLLHTIYENPDLLYHYRIPLKTRLRFCTEYSENRAYYALFGFMFGYYLCAFLVFALWAVNWPKTPVV